MTLFAETACRRFTQDSKDQFTIKDNPLIIVHCLHTITLELNPFIALTDEQFFQLCQHHSDYRF